MAEDAAAASTLGAFDVAGFSSRAALGGVYVL